MSTQINSGDEANDEDIDSIVKESTIVLQAVDTNVNFPQTKLEEMLDNLSPDQVIDKISSFISNGENFISEDGNTSIISEKIGEILDSLSSIRYSAKLIDDTLNKMSATNNHKEDLNKFILDDLQILLNEDDSHIINSIKNEKGHQLGSGQKTGKFLKKTQKKIIN